MSQPITPDSEPRDLLAELPQDEPVVMVNLLRFKRPDGEAHYARYAREVIPHLQAVGARPLHGSVARSYVIGEGERPWWDTILLVEYPSPRAFLEMVGNEDYLKVHEHREAALERAELIATTAWAPEG